MGSQTGPVDDDTLRRRDPFELWHLRSSHANAIRSYWTFEILRKLLRSQQKTIWDDLSTLLGIAASVVTVFAIIEYRDSGIVALVAYVVAIGIIGGVRIYERRSLQNEEVLDDVVRLGIYFDQVANYTYENELAHRYNQSDPSVIAFLENSGDSLRVATGHLRKQIASLGKSNRYPECLAQIGRTEDWAKKLHEQVKSLIGEGFIE